MGPTCKPLAHAIQSFGIDNAQKMQGKLQREYRRCCTADNADDLRDACINFAVTAWHLNEWVWAAVARNRLLKSHIAQLLDLAPNRVDKDTFIQWMLSECPELELCQSICNGSKHTATNGKSVSTVIDYGGQPSGPWSQSDEPSPAGKAYILSDGHQLEADQTFKKVVGYWDDTLQSRWAY